MGLYDKVVIICLNTQDKCTDTPVGVGRIIVTNNKAITDTEYIDVVSTNELLYKAIERIGPEIEYVIIAHDGVVVYPQFIERAIDILDKEADTAIVYSDYYVNGLYKSVMPYNKILLDMECPAYEMFCIRKSAIPKLPPQLQNGWEWAILLAVSSKYLLHHVAEPLFSCSRQNYPISFDVLKFVRTQIRQTIGI
jgi:hypothetical protein